MVSLVSKSDEMSFLLKVSIIIFRKPGMGWNEKNKKKHEKIKTQSADARDAGWAKMFYQFSFLPFFELLIYVFMTAAESSFVIPLRFEVD